MMQCTIMQFLDDAQKLKRQPGKPLSFEYEGTDGRGSLWHQWIKGVPFFSWSDELLEGTPTPHLAICLHQLIHYKKKGEENNLLLCPRREDTLAAP